MKRLLLALLFMALPASHTWADTFPDHPVTVYIGGSAGGTLDIVLRILAPKFEQRFGQPLVIIDKPGAYGMIAAGAVMDTPADGYRLSTITPGALEAMVESKNPSYSPSKLSFVAGLVTFPMLVVVQSERFKDLGELIASKPGLWATSNTIGMLGGDALLDASGITPKPLRMYFRGKEQEMLREVIRGDVPFAIVSAPGAIGLIRGGQLRAIAVIAKKRSSLFPDVPSLAEALSDAGRPAPRKVREPAVGLAAPVGLSPDRKKVLADGFAAMLENPDVKQQIRRISAEDTDWDGRAE